METITHPYSPEFVQLFLPMVENEDITGSMRGEGDNDPVSEFIGLFNEKKNLINFLINFLNFFLVHCRAHYTTV